jgi:hypothetical protein
MLLLALGYVSEFALLASLRAFYPFELEWIAGANIDEMRWIMQDNPLYGDPSITFLPLIYNPFFFILSALVMKILGVGFADMTFIQKAR